MADNERKLDEIEDQEDTIEKTEASEDAVETEEDKRINYAHDDIIEMLRNIEGMFESFNMRFDKVEDALAMFVENGAIIHEAELNENDQDSDFSDFLDIDNLDLTLQRG